MRRTSKSIGPRWRQKSVETTALHVPIAGVELGGDTTDTYVKCHEARCHLRCLSSTCEASVTLAGRHTGGHVRTQIPVSCYKRDPHLDRAVVSTMRLSSALRMEDPQFIMTPRGLDPSFPSPQNHENHFRNLHSWCSDHAVVGAQWLKLKQTRPASVVQCTWHDRCSFNGTKLCTKKGI
jgi:hypothetical protein